MAPFKELRAAKRSASGEFLILLLGLVLLSGCRIRDSWVPVIVKEELKKINRQKAHQVFNSAEITRGNSKKELKFTVDFAPPDKLRFNFAGQQYPAGMIICVSTESYLFLDPTGKRALQIVGLPGFSKGTFTEFRKKALRNSLTYSEANVTTCKDDKTFWELRTKPKQGSLWTLETVSLINKKTKSNYKAMELDATGRVLNQFTTIRRDNSTTFPLGHFVIDIPEDCEVTRIDFSDLSDGGHLEGGLHLTKVPQVYGDLQLRRASDTGDLRIYDYTERQLVFFYMEQKQRDKPLLISPVSREMDLTGGKAYVDYTGNYTSLKWRRGGWDRMIFTNLGPEFAYLYARRISPIDVARQGAASTAKRTAGAGDDGEVGKTQ